MHYPLCQCKGEIKGCYLADGGEAGLVQKSVIGIVDEHLLEPERRGVRRTTAIEAPRMENRVQIVTGII